MKCNICGAELEYGGTVCGVCGNMVLYDPDSPQKDIDKSDVKETTVNSTKKPDTSSKKRIPVKRTGDETVVVNAEQFYRRKFCNKCGRKLDIKTQRCPVCDEQIYQRSMHIEERLRSQRAAEAKKGSQTRLNFYIAIVMTLIALFAITSILFFRMINSEIEQSNGSAVTAEPVVTESPTETEMPSVDDGSGVVHWKPTSEQ